MDPIFFILGPYGLLLLLLSPVYISSWFLRKNQPQKALFWARLIAVISRVLPNWKRTADTHLAACHILLGDYESALPYAEDAVAAYRKTPGQFKIHRATALAYLGIALARTGDTKRAVSVLDEALLSGPFRKVQWQNMLRYTAASVYIQRGRLTDAVVLCNQILTEPKTDADYKMLAQILLSAVSYYHEDFAGAIEWNRKALQGKPKADWVRTMAQINLFFDLIESGDLTQAQEVEAALLQSSGEMLPILKASLWRASAKLALRQGHLDKARELAERAASADNTPNTQADSLLVQAEVFAARQNYQRVLSLTENILQSEAIDFYKSRALRLRESVQSETLHAVRIPVMETIEATQQVGLIQERT